MRLSGLAAGIATFAVLEITNNVLRYTDKVGPGLNVFSSVPETTGLLQATVGALLVVVAAFVYQRSRLGRQLRAARDDPAAARAVGISVYRQRLVAFAISGLLAGFAGGLYVHFLPTGADSLYLDLTFITLAMLVIGGMTSLWGAVVGALAVSGLDSLLAEAENGLDVAGRTIDLPAGTRIVVVGFLMGLVLVLRPSGLTGGREFSLVACVRSVLPSHEGRRHEGLRRRLRCRRVAVRGQSRHARRRRGVGVRPLPGARRRDHSQRAPARRRGRGQRPAERDERCACDPAAASSASSRRRPCTPSPAIAATAHVFRDGGAVASVMNGVGNEETLAGHVDRVIRGTTFPAGKLLEPGVVQWDVKGDTTFGPFEPSPVDLAAVEPLADACTRAGMPANAVADARPPQWRKVIFNASTNPIGALTGLTHGRVCERPDLRALVSGLVDEGKAVATAQGIVLDADPEELIDHAARPEVAYDHKASMLQDVEARRPTEIDYLNGGIARFGRELGVPTPLHDAVAALIKGVEASWR